MQNMIFDQPVYQYATVELWNYDPRTYGSIRGERVKALKGTSTVYVLRYIIHQTMNWDLIKL